MAISPERRDTVDDFSCNDSISSDEPVLDLPLKRGHTTQDSRFRRKHVRRDIMQHPDLPQQASQGSIHRRRRDIAASFRVSPREMPNLIKTPAPGLSAISRRINEAKLVKVDLLQKTIKKGLINAGVQPTLKPKHAVKRSVTPVPRAPAEEARSHKYEKLMRFDVH